MARLLDIQNLNVQYKSERGIVKAVNGIDLAIDEGETLGLVGETGAGKTTAALSVMNLLAHPVGQITKGEILFEEQNVLKMSRKELTRLRGNRISMIFQDPMTSLNPVMTVRQQIAEVIKIHNSNKIVDVEVRVREMLELVGIPYSRSNEYPHQFSGGMKQRVVIAIALACNPKLLIADEPTTALDVTIQAQILALMSQLKKELKTSMLLITHDLGVVVGECDKVAIMYAGEIFEYGNLVNIYKEAAHPYTIGLFNSIPDIYKKNHRLVPIPGLMPDPTHLPPGCCFAPRCSQKMPECDTVKPYITEISLGHHVKCLKYGNGRSL